MTDARTPETGAQHAFEAKVRVGSATGRYASTINGAAMSLIVGTGEVETGQRVLVPFVECEIGGTFGTEEQAATHSVLITFENAVLLAEDSRARSPI